MKAETAAVFRCTPNLSFAVANMIVGIEKYNSNFITDYIIFSTDISDSNNNILYDICNFYKKNIKIIHYKYDRLHNLKLNFHEKFFFKRYPLIIFSLFDIFDLLNEYKNVIALDVDMVVIDRFDDIVNYGNFAFRPARILNEQLVEKVSLFEDNVTPNAGFIYINDSLPNYGKLTSKCYSLLSQHFENIKNTFEETILGILICTEDIKYTALGLEYNCPCCSSKSIESKIIHYLNVKKPWESLNSLRAIPEYAQNVYKVNKITNGKYKNINIENAKFNDTFKRNFNLEYFRLLYDKIRSFLPDYLSPEISPENSFLPLYIKNIDKRIHYNLRIQRNKHNIKDTFEETNKENNIQHIECGLSLKNIFLISPIYLVS